MRTVWAELKRRNVVKVALAYAVVAWLLIQVAATVFPILRLPEWTQAFVTVLLILGFPVALILAWAFELTPEGLRREPEMDGAGKNERRATAMPVLLGIGVLGLVLAYVVVHQYLRDDRGSAPATAALEQSVAVLPFVNMSADPAQEYFSDGISEELLNQLTKIPGLKVAGRTSSFAFKDKNEDLRVIGEQLNVAHILEGSVRKDGDRIRITAQLVKAADGFHLWSQTYDRELNDIFAIQEETAVSVAEALSISLGVNKSRLGVGGTRVFEAYDAFLAGMAFENQLGRENLFRAIGQFEKAVAFDPEYADAWSELAFSYGIAIVLDPDRAGEYERKIAEAVARTVEIAPNAVATYLAEAQLHERHQNWQEAEQWFLKAVEAAPTEHGTNIAYGSFLTAVGRPQDALPYLRQSASMEPLFLAPVAFVGHAYLVLGDFERAIRQFEMSRELVGDKAMPEFGTLTAAMMLGDRALIEETLADILSDQELPQTDRSLTEAMRQSLDSPDKALEALWQFHQSGNFGNPFSGNLVAFWASWFGDHALTLTAMRDVYVVQQLSPFGLWSPNYRETRGLPGFKEIVRETGLADYWRATGNWSDFCRPAGEADFDCR